jgi:hypothetical protein
MLDGKRTLGIAFEGTNKVFKGVNGIADLAQDIIGIDKYYNSLSEFTESVFTYLMKGVNDVEKVLVAGHSLGGSAAQNFMYDYAHINSKLIGVTFGSPGTGSPGGNISMPLPVASFVNIKHDGDEVPMVGLANGYETSGSTIVIEVEDPALQFPLAEHKLYTPLDDSSVSYRKTVDFVTSQIDARVLFGGGNIIAGTEGIDFLYASRGSNGEILLGGEGNDVMWSGLIFGRDSQVFIGGRGNDSIDGGGGIDIAVYTGSRSDYVVQLNKNILAADQLVVSDQRIGQKNEGIDALKNVERLHFSDSALAFDLDGSAGKVAKLIGAVFGAISVANKNYVGIGLSYFDGGLSYEGLADLAINAAGVRTAEQVVSLLWTNIVGLLPTADQARPYIDMLNSGTSIGKLGVLAADSLLNEANVDLVGLNSRGILFEHIA